MINKLRKKFIIIIMSLITTILIVVLAAIIISSYNQYKSQTIQTLSRAFEFDDRETPPFEIGMPREERQMSPVPYFKVIIDSDGNASISHAENVTVPEDVFEEAVSTVVESGKDSGVISQLSLRYQAKTEDDEMIIVFAEMSDEINSMKTMAINAGIIFIFAMLAFFLMSIFLSGLAVRPAERAFLRQQQFFANASHELKTPLTVILANTKILLSNPDSTIKTQKKWLISTQEESKRMKGLVEDMLFLAKSDYEEGNVDREQVNLSDLVWQTGLLFEAVAYENGIELSTQVEPEIKVQGSESKFKELLGILVDNACKYSGSNQKVDITMKKVQGKAVLRVANTGSYISEEDIDHIFERFYRSDKARSGGGYGLGLAIAKEITERAGGTITVSSIKETGTVFTVSLDLM